VVSDLADLAFERPEAASILIGHEDAERDLLDAVRSGRLHHGWLIEGPEGIGKATLAYRFAGFLLTHSDQTAAESAGSLAVSREHPIRHQIEAGACPDLAVLQRARGEDGKPAAQFITVDSVRKVARFLSTTSATGGWRVVIVDSADDMNRNAANALLKMLEEPPQRTVFLLLANAPGRLLPTIRSRCRRLVLKPLAKPLVIEALETAGIGADANARDLAADLADGSLGRAIALAEDQSIETIRSVRAVLDQFPRYDPVKAQTLADTLGRRGAEDRYRLAVELITDWISARMRADAQGQGGSPPLAAVLAPWAEVWEKTARTFRETERLNLDRTQTLLSVFRILSAATR